MRIRDWSSDVCSSDLIRARGFLLGGTAGRTTLNGEGLQHEDGHSHVLASTIPNCIPYDPTFAHEIAVIMHDGLKRMEIGRASCRERVGQDVEILVVAC